MSLGIVLLILAAWIAVGLLVSVMLGKVLRVNDTADSGSPPAAHTTYHTAHYD